MKKVFSFAAIAAFVLCNAIVHAHSGPPFPVVSTRVAGPYRVSIWADPDVTDNQSPAGRFWVTLEPAQKGLTLPSDTHVKVSIRPTDRPGIERSSETEAINGETSRQFVVLLMDHEGPFAMSVSIDGSLGRAELLADVDATYDLRPGRFMLALALLPFLLAGGLWMKVTLRRRRTPR